MTERELYPRFSHYIRDYWTFGSAVFELKIAKTKSFRLAELKDHQERTLSMTQENAIYHKISDQSQGTKPFDSFYLQRVPAFVVLCFYEPGKYSTYFIDIFDWKKFRSTGKKSITEEEARAISYKYCSI